MLKKFRKFSLRVGSDRDALSHGGKKRSSKRIPGKDPVAQTDTRNKESVEKCENILQRLERLEESEKVIFLLQHSICPCSRENCISLNRPKIIVEETIGQERRLLDSPLEHSDKEFAGPREKERVKRAISEPSLISRESMSTPSGREKHRHRRAKRPHKPRSPSRFGYEIADLDAFLTKVPFSLSLSLILII